MTATLRLPLERVDRTEIRRLLQLGRRVVRFGGLAFAFDRLDVARVLALLEEQLPHVRSLYYGGSIDGLHRRLALFKSGAVLPRELHAYALDLLTAFAEHVRRGDADRLLEPDGSHNLAKGPGRCPPHPSQPGQSTQAKMPRAPSSDVVRW